jgi:hypothetical protein
VEVRDCTLIANASAVSVEVSNDCVSSVRITNTCLTAYDTTGAGVSLWTASTKGSVAARLHLQGNRIEAGRVLALAGPVQNLQAHVEANEFTVHEALFSCTGFTDPECWRDASPWHGSDNHYRGPGNWLLMNGKAIELCTLPAWGESWLAADSRPIKELSVLPVKTAIHEPPN